jgi:NADPH2:quinone reductase
MRALQVQELGDPRALALSDVPEPEPRAGEVAIAVHAAGVNFPDVLMAMGQYQVRPPLPFTLGVEVSGVITRVGEGVHDLAVGSRVAALPSSGGFADVAVARASSVVVLPDEVDFVTGAGMLMTYGTAYHALVDRGGLRAGDRLAVTGAGGGVGTAAVDIGRALDARVLAIVGSETKREAALQAGAVHAIVAGVGLADEIKETIDALDVLVDNVGGDVFEAALRGMAWQGRVLIVGFAGGRIPPIPANRVLLRELDVLGVYWGPWTERHPVRNRDNFEAMFELMRDGALHPRVHARYAFEDAPLAVTALLERQLVGKAVVIVRD